MECQSSDSKKLTKVFDASQRKRSKKKRDGYDDSNSIATDDSALGCLPSSCLEPSEKASLPAISAQTLKQDSAKRREEFSLALKAGLVSTPRSSSPLQDGNAVIDSLPQDQDSFIYAFLEEAIKRDKKKQRHHARRREGRRVSHERDGSSPHERDRDRHRHHHRHRDDVPSRDHDKPSKEEPPQSPAMNQAALFETFAKICAQLNEKESRFNSPGSAVRTQSHKSLQCEVNPKRELYDVDRQPVRLKTQKSRDIVANKIRSQENCSSRIRSHEKLPIEMERSKQDKCYCYEKEPNKYPSKLEMCRSRVRATEEDRYREYPPMLVPTRSCIDPYRRGPDNRDYREYERDCRPRHYDDDKRKYIEQKTSRSFDTHRDYYDDDRGRRTARSDQKDRRYDDRDKRYDEMSKYYNDKPDHRKDRRWKKNMERFERNSVASKDDDYRERDRYSERERDSGLSVADGDTSTVSGRSNYLKVVKQQITEQRDAMDKMMKLWKELMRCFKGISQTSVQDKNDRESAASVRESAAEQMRLWWECMRRYETVARDVGDTDARLMEEIKKQRSEMAEMATMWQECLQRYRDISNDFNSLKQKLVTPESPTRMPAAPPLLCAEGEGPVPIPPFRGPPGYPPQAAAGAAAGYGRGGSPLRGRSSAPPPAWWWMDAAPRSPRRRSSPDSRTSRTSRDRDKDRRHRHKDRDDTRYKEKTAKPSAARSVNRHRKR
ncbi:uncharacterized protein LOC142982183 isoform X2 [Anticarsia gemmatalis]|uniref:uncharacterized protein LOC142982183 isoform X2 n=1 Tax=Anticarsia gemmatalis TaxID=129554 RepID=UPI003F763247